jgi:hypothetical protein
MDKQTNASAKALFANTPVLITESKEDYEAIYKDIERRVRPQDIIEQFEASNVSWLVWDVLRYQRSKIAIINAGMRSALEQIFDQLLRDPGTDHYGQISEEAEELAWKWFRDPKAKQKGCKLLAEFQLDESAIEATAIRNALAQIEPLDKLIASAEARLHQALRFIAEYRENLARRLSEAADRLLEDEKVLQLQNSSNETSVVP